LWYLNVEIHSPQAGPSVFLSTKQSVITNNNHNSSTLKILSLNCRSIRSVDTRARFYALVQEHHPDIIIGCKSQIDQSCCSSEVFPVGYHIFCKDRCEGGGGVFKCVKDQFSISEVLSLDTDAEFVWAKILLLSKILLILSISKQHAATIIGTPEIFKAINKQHHLSS